MIKIAIIVVLSLPSFLLSAQQYELSLWGQEVPNYKASGEKEIVEGETSRRISYVQDPAIEVYLPSKNNSTGQAVVICPGGGYTRLAYDKEGTDIAKWLNGSGIAGIVLKYRLPNSKSNIIPHKSPLMDAQQAMKLVRQHAAEWNIDPEKVGIMGFSAGGHLASTLGTHFDESSRPGFMILIYPVVTLKLPLTHEGSRENLLGENPEEELVELYSNETQVTNDTPPTFIVHSMDDKAVPVENSLMLYQSLKEKNIPAEMHLYPYGGHGYSLALNKGRLSDWRFRLIDWLNDLAAN
jgi:acetyl esterase/lipase